LAIAFAALENIERSFSYFRIYGIQLIFRLKEVYLRLDAGFEVWFQQGAPWMPTHATLPHDAWLSFFTTYSRPATRGLLGAPISFFQRFFF
jgi:hypothetical protein